MTKLIMELAVLGRMLVMISRGAHNFLLIQLQVIKLSPIKLSPIKLFPIKLFPIKLSPIKLT